MGDRSTAQNPTPDKLIAGSQIERNGAEPSADIFVRASDSTDSLTIILRRESGVYELQPADVNN